MLTLIVINRILAEQNESTERVSAKVLIEILVVISSGIDSESINNIIIKVFYTNKLHTILINKSNVIHYPL